MRNNIGKFACAALLLTATFMPAFAEEPIAVDRAASAAFWSQQLGSNNYFQRERAAKKLKSLGRDAIPAMTRRALGNDLEASVRSVNLLTDLLLGEDLEAVFEAFESLEKIGRAGKQTAASRARVAVRLMQPQAINRLEEMGAEFNYSYSSMTIGMKYKGGENGLVWLRFLKNLNTIRLKKCDLAETELARFAAAPELNEVVFDGFPLTDFGLAKLAEIGKLSILHASHADVSNEAIALLCRDRQFTWCDLSQTSVGDALVETFAKQKQLNGLDLRGTNFTEAGADQLRQRLPRTKVLH